MFCLNKLLSSTKPFSRGNRNMKTSIKILLALFTLSTAIGLYAWGHKTVKTKYEDPDGHTATVTQEKRTGLVGSIIGGVGELGKVLLP